MSVTIPNGLSSNEVEESRRKHGDNLITPPKKVSLWSIFLTKFEDPIIRILLVVVLLSIGIALVPMFTEGKSFADCDFAESLGILLAVILATGIGFWFEYDANKRFDILNQQQDDRLVKVKREGTILEINRREVVVGDIILLDTGDEVPADGLLLEAVRLKIDESCLTGEMLCSKTIDPSAFALDATYPSNTAMRGTKIMEGRAVLQVQKVGDATEYGKIAQKSTEIISEPTPLNKQLDKLAKRIAVLGYSLAAALFIMLFLKDIFIEKILPINDMASWFTYENLNRFLHYIMVSVTLIVVSVPEGLPMSVTLSLALSVRRMLKENNLVRKMHACETMGAATVICTDKTGTLTQNKMQVNQTFFKELDSQKLNDSVLSQLIKENMSANSTAHLDRSNLKELKPIGNPTEAALLLWLDGQGCDYTGLRAQTKILSQQPFSTETKYMASLVYSPVLKKHLVYLKGAPEIIIDKCQEIPYSEEVIQTLMGYQDQAMRTLAFAYKEIEVSETASSEQLAATLTQALTNLNFTFMGVLAIADPVRSEVPPAVQTCVNAGIQIKMITGDTSRTAVAIARQIGLWKEEDGERNHITGVDFEALSDEEVLERLSDIKIMMRARPADKQRMVSLLQQQGHIVAVTGDGTNDAPALHHANCGLSMGTGTAVAKEASDITLLDDSFNSITTAVKWGRSLYQNIQRFMWFQLIINMVALLIVFLGSMIGHEIPLTVTQMLWVNLIMDTFASAALASLPPNPAVMLQKPRDNNAFIISRKMLTNIIGIGAIFFIVLIALWYSFSDSEGNITPYHLSQFFTFFVMLQFWNLFNAKAYFTDKSAFTGLSKAPIFVLVALLILVGQVLIVEFGGTVFRTVPMELKDWLIIICTTSCVLWVGEIYRLFKRNLAKK
ncbi:MAG: calcium-translocating P-type ATPase, PMCA-type [Bacteroidales bacterium]